MENIDDNDFKGIILLLKRYIDYNDQKAALRVTNLGIKIDTMVVTANTAANNTTRRTRVAKPDNGANVPVNGKLFPKKPNSRMGQRTLAKMMLHGDEETKAWAMSVIPESLRDLPEEKYMNEASLKAVKNATCSEKPGLMARYHAGYIWANIDKAQRTAFYKDITTWWNAHSVKYDPILEKVDVVENGEEEKEAVVEKGEEEKKTPAKRPVKKRVAPKKPASKKPVGKKKVEKKKIDDEDMSEDAATTTDANDDESDGVGDDSD